ncbi:MAG: hypothetical protein R3F07_04250 [Opitutaceae bacterium]
MNFPHETNPEDDSHQVRIACLFSDARTFSSAERQICALGIQMKGATRVTTEWIPVAGLGKRTGSQPITKALAEADMLWISIRTDSELPQPLIEALALWNEGNRGRTSAIVALLHMPVRQMGFASSVELELQSLARIHVRSIFVRRLVESGAIFEEDPRFVFPTPSRENLFHRQEVRNRTSSNPCIA